MAEEVVINFDVDHVELLTTIDLLEKLGQVDAKTAAQFRKATEEYLARQKALKGTSEEAGKLAVATETSGKRISEGMKRATGGVDSLRQSLNSIGRTLGIALGTAELIRFGKEAVFAFTEAELNARKLQTAVGVNGGLQEDFDNLIKQATDLQQISIFSKNQVQQAQTAALQFGLLSDQVEAIIPLVADFAAATGQDLQSALNAVLQGISGSGKALKLYGIEVDASADRATNLASITAQLTTIYKDQGKIIGETTAGQLKRAGNAFDDLKEKVGEAIIKFTEFYTTATAPLGPLVAEAKKATDAAAKTNEIYVNALTKNLKKIFEGLSLTEVEKRINDTQDKAIAATKRGDARMAQVHKESLKVLGGIRTEQVTKLEQNISSIGFDLVKKLAEQGSEIAKQELEKRKAANDKILQEQQRFAEKRIAAQTQLDEILSQLVVDAEADEFEKRKKQAQKDFDDINDELKKIVEIDPALAEKATQALSLAFDVLKEKVKGINKDALAETIAGNKALLDKGLDDIDTFFQRLIDAQDRVKDDPATLVDEVAEAEAKKLSLTKDRIDAQIALLNGLNFAGIETGEDFLAKIQALSDARLDIDKEEKEKLKENEEALAQARVQFVLDTVNEISKLSQAVVDIGAGNTESNIQAIEEERDSRIESIERQEEQLETSRSNERITEAKFNNEKKVLLKQREAAEVEAQKRINAEKRKQDIANRAQKVFEISIATARNIAELSPLQAFLIPFYAALGAAQVAAVLAQPLPKYHTGQKARLGDSSETLAIVRRDEEIFSPEESRKYQPVFRAIRDKKLDMENFSFNLQPSFAQNVSNSFKLDYDLLAEKVGKQMAWELRGKNKVAITNPEAIADALNQNTHDLRRL